jgi:hypothetical protein
MENSNNIGSNTTDLEIDRLRQILNNKINQKKNEIHPSHNKLYNNNYS